MLLVQESKQTFSSGYRKKLHECWSRAQDRENLPELFLPLRSITFCKSGSATKASIGSTESDASAERHFDRAHSALDNSGCWIVWRQGRLHNNFSGIKVTKRDRESQNTSGSPTYI